MTEYQLPEPSAYRWKFKTGPYRDREWDMWGYTSEAMKQEDHTIVEQLYTADQLREEVVKAELRGREAMHMVGPNDGGIIFIEEFEDIPIGTKLFTREETK